MAHECGHCQPSLSEIADASILEDETYTIDLEPFGAFLTSNEDVYSFSAYTDTFAVKQYEMEGSSATIILIQIGMEPPLLQ